jgi:hypothetical protein
MEFALKRGKLKIHRSLSSNPVQDVTQLDSYRLTAERGGWGRGDTRTMNLLVSHGLLEISGEHHQHN